MLGNGKFGWPLLLCVDVCLLFCLGEAIIHTGTYMYDFMTLNRDGFCSKDCLAG